MPLLIDGYNLLYAANVGAARGPGSALSRARRALLDELADRLDEAERERTTIVFDAQQAPPGLARATTYRQLTIRFAPRADEADDLLESLISSDTAPRRLTVVSSDHRIQRAARRRRARAVDSEVWYAELVRRPTRPTTSRKSEKLPPPASDEEVQAWLDWFEQ